MFEEQQVEDQQSNRRGMIVVISIVLVLAIVGTLVYLDSKGDLTSSSASASSAAPAAVKGDPVKDLHFVSEPTMVKDDSGAAAWLLDLRNESQTLTYSHIKFHTTYGGANQSVIAQNDGEMSVTLAPGEEQNVQFKDIQYPDNLQWFRVNITSADASQ
ncbi:MAG TPA: hypothetical protein VMD77_04855 [Candidatus Baltobacteraceae bacterium]|jgi:hypothetical protein|nr:hypothetical protein [Candidatus Baltobacteraceae bacterium]